MFNFEFKIRDERKYCSTKKFPIFIKNHSTLKKITKGQRIYNF